MSKKTNKFIGLMTLHPQIYNYGGLLQEYAMLKVLSKYGEAEIINFNIYSDDLIFSIKNDLHNLTLERIANSIIYRFKRRKKLSKSEQCYVQKRKDLFDEFRENYMMFSSKCDRASINEFSNKYNYIFCGSDQIWNPDYTRPIFFLDFDTDAIKAIYAASIGKNKLTIRQCEAYRKYLDNLYYISCREESVKEILSQYSKNEIVNVLDPTLLLTREEWDIIASKQMINEDYVFCYFLDLTSEKVKSVENFVKKRNLLLVNIPCLHDTHDDFQFINSLKPENSGPSDFISLIKYAKYVITDSFHAAVFSCIYNKDFYVFGRMNGTYDMNVRLRDLLKMFKISDRMINEKELEELFISDKSIEYLEFLKKRETSFQFIENVLNV